MAEEVWMLQTKKADFKQIGARFPDRSGYGAYYPEPWDRRRGGDRPLFKWHAG